MEFRTLHYFLTVAQERNITRAAEKLHGIAPFRMFFRAAPRCGRRKKGAARACARRAAPCRISAVLILRAPSYTLQSWHIFVQGPYVR